MSNEALKLELIEWLAKLNDRETIEYLKVVKDSKTSGKDWWDELSESQKAGIERGLNDIDSGKIVPDEDVRKKYGI